MPRFAANLALMYNEFEFLDRFAAARADGFVAVEAQVITGYPSYELRARLRAHDLRLVLFNAPAGDWVAGERGLAALPGREEDFHGSLMHALSYAQALECPRIHIMAGIVPTGAAREQCRQVLIDNLCAAAPLAAAAGTMLLIEPINPRDFPGYFLNRQDEAHAICAEVRMRTGLDIVRVQMDCYHCQIVEGDLATKLQQYIASIGHIQIAGVPDRHEPDTGEINYPYLFDLMDKLGYAGWVGCEYRPRDGTRAGLGWLRR